MSHAVAFVAEAASKGAREAAHVLEKGADAAHKAAEAARRERAVVPRKDGSDSDPSDR
jgi:hypothetical protein